MPQNTAFYLILLVVMLAIVVSIDQTLFASEKIEEARRQMTDRFTIKIDNDAGLGDLSPAKITGFQRLESSYRYEITITPRLKISGTHTQDTKIIPIVRFKGQSVSAKSCDENGCTDTFLIRPGEDIKQAILTADVATSTPPIHVSENGGYYNRKYSENMPVFVESMKGSGTESSGVMLEAFFSWDFDPNILPEEIENYIATCRVEFVLRCESREVPTSYLIGCTPEGKPGDCLESREICGGLATINVYSRPDCSKREVNMNIAYEGGKMWSPGEEVLVSFWKDSDCTRATSDFRMLKANCMNYIKDGVQMNDLVGGEELLNAGLMPP